MTQEEIVQVERQRNTRIFQGVLALVGVLIVVSLNFWYTAHSQNQNDQKWCSLMVSLDDRYQALPQDANPDAKIFAQQVHALRRDLHCKPSDK
jgi:hypothetical protein